MLRSHLDFLGFSLSWNSGLSHGWFHAVSKAFLSKAPVNYLTSGWMDGFSRDDFKGRSDYVNDMSKKNQHMYAFCM